MVRDEADRAPALGGARAWSVWLIAVMFVAYYFSFQTGYSIVNARVQEDIGLTIAQVGIIAAFYTWVFAVFQFLSGPLLDHIGARKVLLPAIVLVTCGIFLFAGATSFSALLLSQSLIALGACAGFVGAGYVGGTWFGWARFSFMFGLVQFSASLFSAFNQNLLSIALTAAPWRDLFNYVGGLGIVLFAIAVLWLRDPQPVVSGARGPGAFLAGIVESLAKVAKTPMVWVATALGALSFGVMLALGVVWGPKLAMVRGLDLETANLASSLLWLGLASGCFIAPWISDRLGRRKLPIIVGMVVQVAVLALLLYAPALPVESIMALYFAFGFGNSVHMLAFSVAADVVEPKTVGTSAAIVNGIMFIFGGIMISRPGLRVGLGLADGLTPASLDLAQFAARPLMISVSLGLVIALLMRETHPASARKLV